MSKKRKPPRKRKGGGAKKGPPPSPFARAKISRPFARVPRASVQPLPVHDSTANRRRQVRKLLERRGVYPEVIDKIVAMEPEKFYVIEIYGYGSSDPNDDGLPGDEPVKQATHIGSGAYLWERIVGYASRAPMEHVEIEELDREYQGRPLWGAETVKTVSGERFRGHGVWAEWFPEWRDRKKTGRPKKSGGGMNAEERRKNRKSKRDAQKRRQEMTKRYKAMAKTDPIGAERMLARAKRARKVDL